MQACKVDKSQRATATGHEKWLMSISLRAAIRSAQDKLIWKRHKEHLLHTSTHLIYHQARHHHS